MKFADSMSVAWTLSDDLRTLAQTQRTAAHPTGSRCFDLQNSLVLCSCLTMALLITETSSAAWFTAAAMPSARTEVAVAAVGERIYVVGGFGGGRALEIYDTSTDRWSRGASIPQSVHHAAAVPLGAKLYVIGGYSGGWEPTATLFE
ncbi:MAG: hypothetical protein OEN20_13880, partial [Gammaproteobacteria bacterium]|nr:hypothetical protein [Gammaproteobacteria bacterium]